MHRRQGGGTAYPASACEGGTCTHLHACRKRAPAFRETAQTPMRNSVGSRSSHACNGSYTCVSAFGSPALESAQACGLAGTGHGGGVQLKRS